MGAAALTGPVRHAFGTTSPFRGSRTEAEPTFGAGRGLISLVQKEASGGAAAVAKRKIINLHSYITTDLPTYALEFSVPCRQNPCRYWVSTFSAYEAIWQ